MDRTLGQEVVEGKIQSYDHNVRSVDMDKLESMACLATSFFSLTSVSSCEALVFCSIPNCFTSKGHGGVDM